MAIFHLTTKVFSRGKGQSAIAAAAYRSGERLFDEAMGQQKFYVARAERIEFTGMFGPADAPAWSQDRNLFWNRAEQAETRRDGRLAREIEVALPHELTEEQRLRLVKDFVREAFVRKGYGADVALHAPDPTSDKRNHHAHILISERKLGPDGFAARKDPAMNSRAQLGAWREQWATLANRHLERYGHAVRVDHRSLEAQGLEREPTTHLGHAAAEMDRRGAPSERMAELSGIRERNRERDDLRAARATADREVIQLEQDKARPTAGQVGQKPVASPVISEARPAPVVPRPITAPALRVVDHVTGTAARLGDFVTGLLAGAAPPAPRPTDMRAFVEDPEARKQQQLGRLAALHQGREAAAAVERIAQDLEKGKNLNAQDVRKLTPQHQLQIMTFGDDGMRQIVDEARKRSERYWKGEGREREL